MARRPSVHTLTGEPAHLSRSEWSMMRHDSYVDDCIWVNQQVTY